MTLKQINWKKFNWKFYLAFGIITIAGLVYLYLVINDSIHEYYHDREIKGVNLPYILTVDDTYKDYKFSNATISFKTVTASNIKNLKILIISPTGKSDYMSIENRTTFAFPKDFVKLSMPFEKGVYQVILYNSSNNTNITSVKMDVVDADILNSISKRLLGQTAIAGVLALAVPLGWLIKYAGGLYLREKDKYEQALIDKEKEKEKEIQESNLRLEKKLSWMQQNMKYYLHMATACYDISSRISSLFGYNNMQITKNHFDISLICNNGECKNYVILERILRTILKFMDYLKEFESTLGFYYFDNIDAEIYVNQLMDIARNQSERLFSSRQEIVQFEIKYNQLPDNAGDSDPALVKEFKALVQDLGKGICRQNHHACSPTAGGCCNSSLECYFRNLLTLYYVITISIDKIGVISYSGINVKEDLKTKYKTFEPQIKEHAMNMMPIIFGAGRDRSKLWNDIFDIN